jgi:hypothetical protein
VYVCIYVYMCVGCEGVLGVGVYICCNIWVRTDFLDHPPPEQTNICLIRFCVCESVCVSVWVCVCGAGRVLIVAIYMCCNIWVRTDFLDHPPPEHKHICSMRFCECVCVCVSVCVCRAGRVF